LRIVRETRGGVNLRLSWTRTRTHCGRGHWAKGKRHANVGKDECRVVNVET
jgi:hypothetical protein